MTDHSFDERSTLESPSGAALNLYRQRHRGRARGVLLVHHGLAEHAARYGPFAAEIAELGVAVYAHDHRGHGSTRAPDAPLRRFARRNGAAKVLADCRAVHEHARADHPELPFAVFGHSMGGLIAMNYAEAYGNELAGVAMWNSGLHSGAAERLARVVLAVEKALKGSDVSSLILSRATFEAWGKSVVPRRTMFDWLSHEPEAVDAYVRDPLCGWTPSISMMEDVVMLILDGSRGIERLPPDLPLHLLAGSADPATRMGAAVRELAGRLRATGLNRVELQIVEGARHETLQESRRFRMPAMTSLSAFLNKVFA